VVQYFCSELGQTSNVWVHPGHFNCFFTVLFIKNQLLIPFSLQLNKGSDILISDE
jgi:hypothetical protein